LIACWPNGIQARGELRQTMGHCIDILPTICELAGIKPDAIPLADGAPPLPGKSLVPALAQDGRVSRDHIYFHHVGNRALRVGDWKLVTESLVHQRTDHDAWPLYNLATDRCEMKDLSRKMPDKCLEMQARWQQCEDRYRTRPEGAGLVSENQANQG